MFFRRRNPHSVISPIIRFVVQKKTILFSTYTARQPNIERVQGERAEIASRTNACGIGLLFLVLIRSLPGIEKKSRGVRFVGFAMIWFRRDGGSKPCARARACAPSCISRET
jgi:hypothetical protein